MGKPKPRKVRKQSKEVAPVSVRPTATATAATVWCRELVPVVKLLPNSSKRAVGSCTRLVLKDPNVAMAVDMTTCQLDPIDPHDAHLIVSYAVRGLMTQMLPSIFFSGQHVFDDGELCFDRDSKPLAPPVDRHGSKLVRKKVKRREQHYATVMKASTYGSYAQSRASSHTASRFGGSRAPSVSVRSAAPTSKVSTFLTWSQDASFTSRDPAAPSSIGSTARMSADFVELQRRAAIERDLSTRESQHRSTDEANRKGALRPKLRSLADPSISLEKEEAMAVLAASAARSRLQPSRQGTRGKTPGIPALSPLNCKPASNDALDGPTIAGDEKTTFRTEDYEGLASDVVLLGKGGELVVGENCFVVARKPRHDLLLDLQQRNSVEPRVQLLATPKRDEETSQVERSLAPKQRRVQASPSRSSEPWKAPRESLFEGQIGLFESSPTFTLDLKTTPLAKGVALKLADTFSSPARHSCSDLLLEVPDKASGKAPIRESATNAKLEKELGALLKVSDKNKSVLATESKHVPQKAPAKSTPAVSPRTAASPQVAKSSSATSLVLPKHIHHGEKHLQSLRIRTPACPNRLSRKPSSRSSLLAEGDEDGWPNEGMESLFSLHEHCSSAASLPKVKYMREFPNPPLGHIRVFGSASQETDWTLPAPSPFPFASLSATINNKR